MQRQKKVGGLVSKASTKYVSNVHAKAASGKAEVEIKRTMKASRIQRDVVSSTNIECCIHGNNRLLLSE